MTYRREALIALCLCIEPDEIDGEARFILRRVRRLAIFHDDENLLRVLNGLGKSSGHVAYPRT